MKETPQRPAAEWHEQWSMFQDSTEFLFREWLAPVKPEDFRGLTVLEGGCGCGQHTEMMSAFARHVTAVDLNTSDLARERNRGRENVSFVAADLGTMELPERFDAVVSVGVVHHTDDPTRSFENLYAHLKPGGIMALWVYSAEGNAFVRFAVEPVRKLVLRFLPRRALVPLSWAAALVMWPFAHTLYRVPGLEVLPYYEYLANFRRLSLARNMLNVFDKLNAPQTHFIRRALAEEWFSPARFRADSISIRPWAGVSWSLSGIKVESSGCDASR